MPSFPSRAAERTGADEEMVRTLLTHDAFRRAYWGGVLPEDAFWRQLGVPVPDPARRHQVLDLRPRIDAARVSRWRDVADVWVVSNHRHEWLMPVLADHGFEPVVDRIDVSSLTGRVKPDPSAWEALLADGLPPGMAVAVDDQQANLDAAASLGIHAVRAEGAGAEWADAVDAWLASLP